MAIGPQPATARTTSRTALVAVLAMSATKMRSMRKWRRTRWAPRSPRPEGRAITATAGGFGRSQEPGGPGCGDGHEQSTQAVATDRVTRVGAPVGQVVIVADEGGGHAQVADVDDDGVHHQATARRRSSRGARIRAMTPEGELRSSADAHVQGRRRPAHEVGQPTASPARSHAAPAPAPTGCGVSQATRLATAATNAGGTAGCSVGAGGLSSPTATGPWGLDREVHERLVHLRGGQARSRGRRRPGRARRRPAQAASAYRLGPAATGAREEHRCEGGPPTLQVGQVTGVGGPLHARGVDPVEGLARSVDPTSATAAARSTSRSRRSGGGRRCSHRWPAGPSSASPPQGRRCSSSLDGSRSGSIPSPTTPSNSSLLWGHREADR